MKLVVAFLHYGPYHRARLAACLQVSTVEGFSVMGLEMARTQAEYAWSESNPGFGIDQLFCASPDLPLEVVGARQWLCRLRAVFDELTPEICFIAGYSHPAMLTLISLCLTRGVPWVLMSDSQETDAVRRKAVEWLKSRVVKLSAASLVAGRPHRAYLRQLGMPDDRIFEGYDAVDNDTFARGAACWREVDGPQTPYFLASNRFIEKKNLFRLLSAYAIYLTKDQGPGTKDRHPWPLVLLGDGELRTALLAHARILGLTVLERAPWESPTRNEEPGTKNRPAVYLPGFRQIDELPRFYAHAGAFVHASTTEQWGLVVNEAMAGGLPVIVSNRCGCAPDLVRDGQNGWTFDPLDETALAGLLGRVAALDDAERTRLGEAGREIIGDWGPERFAVGLLAAANKAVEVGPKRAGWFDRLLLSLLVRRPGGTE